MTTAVVVFAICYLLIAVANRIPNAVIAIIGAMLMVFLGAIDEHAALEHIDMEVILLLAGMMSLAAVIGRTGAFDWAALKSAQLVRGNGFLTLCLMSAITAVASALLDNVTVVVLAVPITLALCRTLGLKPVPFLLAQVFASNIGGTATVVGDPPNIIIAAAADISFVDFMSAIAPVSVLGMGVLFGLLYLWFRNDTVTPQANRELVMTRNAAEAIRDRGLLVKSGVVFGLTLTGFLIHDLLHVRPAFIAVAGAGVLLLVSEIDPHEVLKEVEWPTLAFFIGLFILVGALVETGATERLSDWMIDIAAGSQRNMSFLLVWVGGIASAIVDNIPFTATMVEIVPDLTAPEDAGRVSPLWWALALGADLGGNATAIGASANVIVISLANKQGHTISFMHFLKYGLVISAATLVVSTLYLWLRFYL